MSIRRIEKSTRISIGVGTVGIALVLIGTQFWGWVW